MRIRDVELLEVVLKAIESICVVHDYFNFNKKKSVLMIYV